MPLAMFSKIVRYCASEYLFGSFPTSTDVTSPLPLVGPKNFANASPYARALAAGSFHLSGGMPNIAHASISNPALFHDAYIVPQSTRLAANGNCVLADVSLPRSHSI